MMQYEPLHLQWPLQGFGAGMQEVLLLLTLKDKKMFKQMKTEMVYYVHILQNWDKFLIDWI